MSETIQQRSNDWRELRRGKCTASELHKIMGVQSFGKTGETYAFEKACEIVFGLPNEDEEIETFDMQRGVNLEPLAFSKFKELKDFDFLDVFESPFIDYNEYSGASPDGLVSDNSNLEIKCPKRQGFFNIIAFGESAIKKEYVYQMQFQMMSSKTDKTYFFNYYIDNGSEMWHEIEVYPDEKKIKKINERLPIFFDRREFYINELNKNIQFKL